MNASNTIINPSGIVIHHTDTILLSWIFQYIYGIIDHVTEAKTYAEALASATLPHSVELAAQVMAVLWRQPLPSKSPKALRAARGSPAGMRRGKIHLEDEKITQKKKIRKKY